MPTAYPTPEIVLEEVFREYDNLPLRFSGPQYWETLKLTYVRTLRDIVALAEVCKKREPRRAVSILEVGAFTGVLATACRRMGFEVTAADMPLFMEDPALKNHFKARGIDPLACDLSHLPLAAPADTFDIVVCCEVLEHLNFNVLPVLLEFHRLIRPRGYLYLATPNQGNIATRINLARGRSIHNPVADLTRQLDPTSDFSIGLHWREYTESELREMLELTGFEVRDHYFCHYNSRQYSAPWRRMAVGAMYRMFPAFLPGQVIVGAKEQGEPDLAKKLRALPKA